MSALRDRLFRRPPQPPPYVLEDTAKAPPVRLFRLFGIDWMAYPTAWIAPIWMVAVGMLISFLARSGASVGERLTAGLVYGGVIGASIVAHYLGGAIAGKLVNAPMRFVFFTATLAYCRYDESPDYPERVRLIRSLGQPAAHLVLAVTTLGLYVTVQPGPVLLMLAIVNLVFLVVSMTPLPTMHGGVLLRYLRARR